MTPTTNQIDQETKDLVKETLKSLKIPAGKQLFTISYKQAAILRPIVFQAIDLKDAERVVELYMRHLESIDGKKALKIGNPKPFAMDIEDEIQAYKDKQK